MTKSELLGLPPDAMERWRADAERQEREFAEQRRREQEEEDARRAKLAAIEAASLRDAFDQRIAALEEEIADLQSVFVGSMQAVRGMLEDLADQREHISIATCEELRDLRNEVAKLHSTLTEVREERAKGFQFAREKDGVADLPNFLPQRRVN
jgi:hypothetical protein